MNNSQNAPSDWIDGKLPPPIHGTFIGGNKPPGGGFAKFQHLDRRYDGKSLRKAVNRRTIDYQPTIIRYFQERVYRRKPYDQCWIQPEKNFVINYMPTFAFHHKPMEMVTTKFVHASTNKIKCPVNVLKWTPDGRRLITGSTSGEFTLWNGSMFNFETILQAHDAAVRSMIWSHNENWMVTSDQLGIIKYWQPNMNNVNAFQAHREPIRSTTLSPTDLKLASGSDDSTIKIWDFNMAREELMLTGHGWDVKCVSWHPTKSLLASGSKDNLVKLWDPKSGKNLSTFHGHKNTILGLEWNKNGNWILAGSRDQLIKLYDIRMMREVFSFKGHKREINSLAWHPYQEELFVSGGSEGAMYFWLVGESSPVAALESAHDSNVWYMDWHPLGQILASGSNDHATRFWVRHRPGDVLNDSFIVGKSDAEKEGMHHHHYNRNNYQNNQNNQGHNQRERYQQQAPKEYAPQPISRPEPPSASFSHQGILPGLSALPSGFRPDYFTGSGGMIPGLSTQPDTYNRQQGRGQSDDEEQTEYAGQNNNNYRQNNNNNNYGRRQYHHNNSNNNKRY